MAQSSLRISVVIAACNVENFIGAAVRSALEQTHPFDEIIVINDASTDRTGDIIDRLYLDHPELIVVHHARNAGLGPVRNIGIDKATGDYICFLDGDDYFLTDAVLRLRDQLLDQPDIVLYNYARFYPNGTVTPNVMSNLLAAGRYRSVGARKALFGNLNVAWNKLYARNFLIRTGLRFPIGKYEDIAWNYMCLMLANEIITTSDVLVHYRQRDGSILNARNLTHFDIFDRWAELFEQLQTHPDLMREYSDILKVRRFKSLGIVLDHPRRLPQAAKPRFASRIRKTCGPVKALPAGNISKAEAILDLPGGIYLRPFLRSVTIRQLRAGGVSALRWLKGHRHALKILLYRFIFLRLPIDPNLVVYQSYWGTKVACNPYSLFLHLQDTRPHLSHVWVIKGHPDLRHTVNHAIHVSERSVRYYYLMARAGVLINNANFPDEIEKREGSIHVQTKHGTPLKYMGLDQLRVDPTAFADPDAFAARCARWDYVVSSNEYSTHVWRQSFPYNYKVIETGYPRNDRLVEATNHKHAPIRARLGLPDEAEVVLYAPTFRPLGVGTPPSEYSKDDILSAILDGLGPKQVLAVRDHYYLKSDSAMIDDPRLFDLTKAASSTDVLLATDLLITDYSSIMFDYAVRKKPIVIFGHDWGHYQATRGAYFDISKDHPGIYCDNLSALTEAIATRAYEMPVARGMQEAFQTRFCHLDDGKAAERICDIVFANAKGD